MSLFLDCPAEQRVLQENILPFIRADRRKMLRNKHVRGDLSPHMRSTFQGRDWMGGSVAFLSSPPFQVAACKGLELPEEKKSLLLIFNFFFYWEEWNETQKIVYESCRSGFDFFFFSGSFKNSHSCVQLPVGSNQHGLEGLGADKQTAAQRRSTALKSAAQVSDQSVPKQQQ